MPADPHNDWIADEAFFDEGWADMERRLDERERRPAAWWWVAGLVLLVGLAATLLLTDEAPEGGRVAVEPVIEREASSDPTTPLQQAEGNSPVQPEPMEVSATPLSSTSSPTVPIHTAPHPGKPGVRSRGGTTSVVQRRTTEVVPPHGRRYEVDSGMVATSIQRSGESIVPALYTRAVPRVPVAPVSFPDLLPLRQSDTLNITSFRRRSQVDVVAGGGIEPAGGRLGYLGGVAYAYPVGRSGRLTTELSYRYANYQLRAYALPPPLPPLPSPAFSPNSGNLIQELADASADNLNTRSLRWMVGYRRDFGRRWSIGLSAGADYLLDLRLANVIVRNDELVLLDEDTSFFANEFAYRQGVTEDLVLGASGVDDLRAFSADRLRLVVAGQVGFQIGGRWSSFLETVYLPQPVFADDNPSVAPVRINAGLRFRLR